MPQEMQEKLTWIRYLISVTTINEKLLLIFQIGYVEGSRKNPL